MPYALFLFKAKNLQRPCILFLFCSHSLINLLFEDNFSCRPQSSLPIFHGNSTPILIWALDYLDKDSISQLSMSLDSDWWDGEWYVCLWRNYPKRKGTHFMFFISFVLVECRWNNSSTGSRLGSWKEFGDGNSTWHGNKVEGSGELKQWNTIPDWADNPQISWTWIRNILLSDLKQCY